MKRMKKINIALILMLLFSTSMVLAGETATTADEYTEISNKIGVILNVIAWIGYAIAVGMLIVIGIKYMMSAANERADVKKGLVNYVIGVIIIGMAATIANIVSTIAMSGSSATSTTGMAQEIVDVGKELGNLAGE